jgi:DNA-binding NarL/FixJ family response regulator
MRRLSSRQRDVLMLISKGFHNAEISQQLGVSERLVKSCVRDLLIIFDASNRTELAGMQGTVGEEAGIVQAGS